MTAHVKTEQLFFTRQLFMFGPRSDASFAPCLRVRLVVEERYLAGGAIAVGRRGEAERFVNAIEQLGAVAAGKIKGTRIDQTFQHFTVGHARPRAAATI